MMITRDRARQMISSAILVDWLKQEGRHGTSSMGYSGRYREDVDMLYDGLTIIMVNGKVIFDITIDIEHEKKKEATRSSY